MTLLLAVALICIWSAVIYGFSKDELIGFLLTIIVAFFTLLTFIVGSTAQTVCN